MANRDPENFVSFDDYMGLNEQAGKDAMARLLASKAGTEADPAMIQKLTDEHRRQGYDQGYGPTGDNASFNTAAATEYDRNGAAAKSGLASYGEFLTKMDDPAARQAALQEMFGGNASMLDSAVVGGAGGGQLGAAHQGFKDLSGRVDSGLATADASFAEGKLSRGVMDKHNAETQAAKQKQYDDIKKAKYNYEQMIAARKFWAQRMSETGGQDKYGHTGSKNWQDYETPTGAMGVGTFGYKPDGTPYTYGDLQASGQDYDTFMNKNASKGTSKPGAPANAKSTWS